MLPPGTLQTLIRRYQAARQKMEELAVEVAAALSLPSAVQPMAAEPVRRRAPAGQQNGGPGTKPWRVDQIVATIRKHGPSSARDLVRLIPGLTMGGAYTAMSNGVRDHLLVRTEKGVYTVADSPAALPAILRQAVKGKKKEKKKGEAKPVPVAKIRAAPGGGVSQQQRIVSLAQTAGSTITPADVVKAGISASRKLAQQHLSRAVRLDRFERIGVGQYRLKKSPAKETARSDGPLFSNSRI